MKMKKHLVIVLFLCLNTEIQSCSEDLSQSIKNSVNFSEGRGFHFMEPIVLTDTKGSEIKISFAKIFPTYSGDDICMIANIRKNNGCLREIFGYEREDLMKVQYYIDHPGHKELRPINFPDDGGRGFVSNEIMVFLGPWNTFLSTNPFPDEGLSTEMQQRLLLERLLFNQPTRTSLRH